MEFHSYKNQVLSVLKLCKKEFAEGVGTLVIAEAQSLTPVDTGNLRRSEVFEVMANNDGVVVVGVTPDAPYGLYVEKGIGQKAQPFLEPGAINSIDKIVNVAEQVYRKNIGGDR